MNGDQLPINQLHDINWDTLNHAFHVPQLTTMYVCVYVCI